MPPKSKTAAIPTVEELHAINDRLLQDPKEEDFIKILPGAKGDEQVKSTTARLITNHIKKIEKSQKDAVKALIALVGDESPDVKIYSLRGLKDFFKPDQEEVIKAVISAMAAEDTRVADQAAKMVNDLLGSNEDFKKVFINQIKDQEPQVQSKMVDIAREQFKFTEENVDELITLIDACFDCNVISGLKLLRVNKKIVTEEKKAPVVQKLLENLEGSLETDFKNVTGSLLTGIMYYIPSVGKAAEILNLVAKKVLPKFEEIEIENKIRILQLIADNAKAAEDPIILENLFKYVYLSFPKVYDQSTKINFSFFESALFAFYNLSRRFSSKASELTGQLLVITGQPDENEGLEESKEKRAEFEERLESVDPIAEKFVQYWGAKIEAAKDRDIPMSDEEKKKQKREAKIAMRTGNNVRHFCRILRRDNFITQTPPSDVSWRKPAAKDTKKGKFASKVFKGKESVRKPKTFHKSGRDEKRSPRFGSRPRPSHR